MKPLNDIKNLYPILQSNSFPFLEKTFDDINEYAILARLEKAVNEVITNNNALNDNFTELNNYVTDYFKNLDVQDEIDNKLQKMAEDGTLQEIITSYLKINGILAFNTLNDLKNATNIIDGSFAKTYGKEKLNDGYGSFYKIRNITSSDIVDNINIIPINNSETLIAERINNIINNLEGKKFILIGDSYGTIITGTNTVKWTDLFKENLGLADNQVIQKCVGGARFSTVQGATTFLSLLKQIPDSNEITDIIVCGGYNDQGVPETNITAAVQAFKTYANTHFPNAQISIGFIGTTTNYQYIYNVALAIQSYIYACKTCNIRYLNDVEFSLSIMRNAYISNDMIHPNDAGQKVLGYNIAQSYLYGSCSNWRPFSNLPLTENDNFSISGYAQIGITVNNNIRQFCSQNDLVLNSKNENGFSFPYGNSEIELCKINGIYGNLYNTCNFLVSYLIQVKAGTFFDGVGVCTIKKRCYLFQPSINR